MSIKITTTGGPLGVTFEAGKTVAEADARLAVERLLMDRLARRLMPEDRIDALDPSLRWSLSPSK